MPNLGYEQALWAAGSGRYELTADQQELNAVLESRTYKSW
jgi:hypothetical protein